MNAERSRRETPAEGTAHRNERSRFRWRIDVSTVTEASWTIVGGVLLFSAVYFVLAWSNVELIRGVSRPVSAVTGGLVTPTLIIYLPLLVISIGVLFVWLGGLGFSDVGLEQRDLPLGIVVTVIAWGLIQFAVVLSLLDAGEPIAVNRDWYTAGVLVSIGPLVGQLLGNALYEEVVMRGFLLVQLHKRARRIWGGSPGLALFAAVVGSQLIFASLHVPNRLARGADWNLIPLAILLPFLIGILLALVYYRTGNLFIAIGLHAFMNTPTLVVGPQGLGETYAVYLAIVVAVGWPWFHRVATRTGLTGTSEDESSVSE